MNNNLTGKNNLPVTPQNNFMPQIDNSCILGTPSVSSEISDTSTSKFLKILDKINENQSKKNKFYSQIIKDYKPETANEEFTNCSNINNIDNTTNIGTLEHLLEAHQPNQNDIIFECSKEWTVNQTPELREKEAIPAHLALQLGKMGFNINTSDKKRSKVMDYSSSSNKKTLNNCASGDNINIANMNFPNNI